ncbi:hypothetical protein [Microbacterium sp. BH-3-3-3]|uniref:hypothetical protein n=1 Tax=Microbacterium sp. BH-3-3-3 TaxID=1906742 RepID=UPI0011A62897|nr:hypothetical protein [Microbacterium sp. BH-3-3-3]
MSVPLLAGATATAPARAARATGDPATGARFGDALSHAARTLVAGDGDPAAASSSASGRITVAGLSTEASVSGGDDPAPGDESSLEGPDAGTPAPVAMTLVPFPVPPTPESAEPRAAAEAADALPLTSAPVTEPAGTAGETVALSAAAGASLSPAAAGAPLSPVAADAPPIPVTATAVLASAGPAPGAHDDAASPLPPVDERAADRSAAAVAPASVRPAEAGAAPVASPTGGAPAAPAPTPGAAPAIFAPAPATVPSVPETPAAASGTPAASVPDDASPAGTALSAAVAPASQPTEHAPSTPPIVATTGVAAAAPVPASVPLAPSPPVETAAPTATQRSIAAQVAPAVVHIAQRAPGVHQITLTVSPDSIGPVTVRAHIGSGGEVRIDLAGATEAGRDALRVMIAELRRDLASVLPHAHLSVGSGPTADTGAGDRGAPGGDGSLADQPGRGREPRPDAAGASAPARASTRPLSAPSVASTGGGLDIVV